MEENQKKNVGKALTTDEIRLRASKWTLAGDAGLLAHLEQFSQNLQSKSEETQNNINALYDAFGDASSTINNVTNQFLALQNSQFVENRVYDDESPNEEQKIDEKVSKEEQEKSLLAQYKTAVELGVKILDTHFEEVQLPPNSDSDEEEGSVESTGLVWKSKNLYACKRFPLLIGSAGWWADDSVGLGDYEENINPETLSSESESDLDEENTADKRTRMSSSSSTESERILSKKPKEQIGSEYNDIFAPVGKDLLNIKSDLLSKNDSSKLIKSQNVSGIGENINPLNLPQNNGEEVNSYLPKQDKSYMFDDNEDGNSEEDVTSESKVPAAKQNKISSSFTRELESKLSSVANKNVKEQSHKNTPPVESGKEEKSALFDDNDDNDDLFSGQNSASNALLKKKSIFSEEDDDDQLFGNSENLFSGSEKGATPKKSVKISTPVGTNGSPKEKNSSHLFDKSDKFSNDNLFDGNDDFLFSGKSGLSSSHNSGAPRNDWKTSRDVKFSTPTEGGGNREVPGSDIFGGVSEIRSNASSNVESVSAVGHEIDNSFNFSRVSSADNSKDYGFVEPSDFSNNKSRKVESPELFDPLLTSTRHIPSDTSDYKTHRTTSSQIIQTKSESSVPQLQDDSNSRVGHSQSTHFSRYQSDDSKNKGLFDEDDDDDDLFQTNKLPNPVKNDNLFDDNENDNLFGGALPKVEQHKPVLEEKEENTVVSQKPSLPPVEDDEEGKFSLVDKLKQDSVSMSSSRSSLFDDVNVGKTNLASVFDSDKSSKNSNDLFGQTDENLFEGKKTKSFGEHNVEDLFGEKAIPQTKTDFSSSLFDDLEDADDLFRDNVSKKVFEYRDDDDDDDNNADLFGNPLKDNDKNSSAEKAFGISQRKGDTVIGSKPNPDNKTEQLDTTAKKFSDNIFGESKKLVKNVSVTNADKITVKDKPKPKSSAVSSLFGELEDEDEDLFSNVKNTEKKRPTGKIFEEPESESKSKGLVDDDENDDAIFKVGNSKDSKVIACAEVEGGRVTYDDEPVNGPSGYNGKTEMSLSCDEKSEESKSISPNSTSNNNSNNGKNDLFSGKENLLDSRTSNPTLYENKLLKTEKKVVEVNDNFFNKSTLDYEKRFDEKPTGDGPRPFPPNSLRLNLASNQDSSRSETDGLVISSEKEKVIGKLNIPAGLKINPMCLLPGATIKKNVTAEDLKKETREEEEREDLGGSTESKPSESAPNLLKCLSKDRVKIQTRRRPQTRRARHEALRSSGIDFEVNTQEIASVASRSKSVDDFEKSTVIPSAIKSSSDTNVNDPVLVNSVNEMDKVMENADSSSSIFHSVENSPDGLFSSPMLSNPLSPSTDGEDYFNVPELDVNFEKEDQSIFQSNLNDFKNTGNTDDNLLFGSAPVLSPLSPDGSLVKKEKRLEAVGITSDNVITDGKTAADEQDEDNLFKVDEAKSPGLRVGEKKSEHTFGASNIFDDSDEGDSFLFQKKPISILGAKEVNKNKKTLFDDDDDNDEDDDLFNEKLDPTNTKSKMTIESVSKNQVNKSTVAEKSKEPFTDPLGLITKPG